jgi:hypothetical protein
MASIDELKRLINLHDLADRLGLKQGKGGDAALYHSPHHPDKHPSLSIFQDHPKHGTGWRDHSLDIGGSCIDLVMHVLGGTPSSAMKYLHETFGIAFDAPTKPEATRAKTQLDYIADRSLKERDQVRDYLLGRGISRAAIDAGLNAKTLGFNDYVSSTRKPGDVGYCGPSAAFIVRPINGVEVVAVDMRFIDPALNGDVKTQTQGAKDGYGWCADPRRLTRAHRVVLVESSINALSVDTCEIPGTAAYSIRGIANAQSIDLTFLRGKQVVICMDNDAPFPEGHHKAGHRPGPEAAWVLYERLTALSISALMVDQSEWIQDLGDGAKKIEPINDANDYLQIKGASELAKALDTYEPWIIPGQAGDATRRGVSRVFLPSHDYQQYWRFRTRPDFTSFIAKMEEAGEDGEKKTPTYIDLCGFRVASLSRVSVASAQSTMTGDVDQSPSVYFAVTAQTARNGAKLTREVLQDKQIHNLTHWQQFGPIWEPKRFSRMVNILERAAHLGARNAANFVGLCWKDGSLAVNEGPDCYFTEAEKQCPYHNLTFPSGPRRDAARVIAEYQKTFKQNAATILLAWSLGGHLKALLGFWPHMTLQADKGAGKSTLIKRLERTISFTMFSGQSLQTEFRLITSISHTSHPVGWEELSARRQDVIDKAVGLLQENYQYTVSRRGSEMTEYLMSAPVLLAGEDVPVRSLLGKLVRANLTGKKGPKMPEDMPRFPVREWLQFLAGLDKTLVQAKYADLLNICLEKSRAGGDDDGAIRMAGNYAAIALAWRYLCEFADISTDTGAFGTDLIAEMNLHISETSSDRSPWVWIMETCLSEIDAGNYKHPHKFEHIDGEECLLLQPGHVMDHLSSSNALREKWNGLPVKTATVFKRQLTAAGVTVGGDKEIERTIFHKRVRHLSAFSLRQLNTFGLNIGFPADQVREN